jgi:hypothetical protein
MALGQGTGECAAWHIPRLQVCFPGYRLLENDVFPIVNQRATAVLLPIAPSGSLNGTKAPLGAVFF